MLFYLAFQMKCKYNSMNGKTTGISIENDTIAMLQSSHNTFIIMYIVLKFIYFKQVSYIEHFLFTGWV